MQEVMNGKKQISLLLLLGFSVLLGHSLIPHYHHSDILFGTILGKCTPGHDDHHDSGKSPVHCHAFNNVDFFKNSQTSVQQEPKKISTLMLLPTQVTTEETSACCTNSYICLKLPGQSIKYSGAVSLRAPPQFL